MLTPILIGLGALVTSFVVSAAFKSAVNGISNAINRAKENKLNKQKEKKNRKKQNNKTNKNVIPEKDNVKDKTITVDNAKETIQRYIDTSREVLNADFNSLTSNKIKSLPFITVFNN